MTSTPSKRPFAAVRQRLARCQQCEHFQAKRFRPLLAGDGYCGRLTCRLSRAGLAAYISDPSSTCPLDRWQTAGRAATSSPAIDDPPAQEKTAKGTNMPNHVDLRHDSPIEWVKELLAQPPGPWPAHWAGLKNVEAAFVELFDEFCAGPMFTPPVDWSAEATPSRGIVMCGGGWRFFPSLYVTIRMIRHVGCALPIQVWYLGNRGEFDPRFAAALDPLGVEWVDADAEARKPDRRRRILGGWEVKPFALAYAPWREVFFLDADAYPTDDLDRLIDHPRTRESGAVFWPDQNPLKRCQFERFGVAPRDEPAFESGQLFIDKQRHWRALCATIFMNDFSDYVYRHVYGDKDTFHLAWRKVNHDYAMPAAQPGWNTIAFVHQDFDGRPAIIHRTRDKFRFGTGRVDGMPVGQHQWYMTPQWSFSSMVEAHGGRIAKSPHAGCENLFVKSLPMENEAHAFLAELETIVRPLGQSGPTANQQTIAATASDFAGRRRSRRAPRVLMIHPRSGSPLAAGIVRQLAERAGQSVRPFTITDCPCSRRAAQCALDHAGAAIHYDASPEVFELLDQFAHWRGVHVVRDPRDVIVSAYLATRERLGSAAYATDPTAGLLAAIDGLAPLWSHLRLWPADGDSRLLVVPFGELVGDTAAAVERIAAHFGWPVMPAAAAAIARDQCYVAPAAREARLTWRELFTPDVFAHCDFQLGDLVERFGDQARHGRVTERHP